MKATIRAIFQKGVLKPVDTINLRENDLVKVTIEDAEDKAGVRGEKNLSPEGRFERIRGLFSTQDLMEIEAALRDCRQVDPDGW